MQNPKTQFEIISFNRNDLIDIYKWCINNLRLKENVGVIYQFSEVYVITRSQRIIDKLNKYLGSSFEFNNWSKRIFYIN